MNFSLGRNERSVQHDQYDSAHEFLEKMDTGELDNKFSSELKKLSKEQLDQVAQVLAERDEKRRR